METVALNTSYLQDKDKREICEWQYEEPYAVYNLPSYEEMENKKTGFMNPEREHNYQGYYHNDVLVGYTNMQDRESEVYIGIGVRPDLCSKGYGKMILDKAYDISKKYYPDKPLYLEVRAWNKRAINCYLKAGFEIDGEMYQKITPAGEGTFYRMVKK